MSSSNLIVCPKCDGMCYYEMGGKKELCNHCAMTGYVPTYQKEKGRPDLVVKENEELKK